MQMAIDLAKENVQNNHGGPFGAVICKEGKIVGKGINMVTNNNDPTAHAEVVAIRDACNNLNTFDLTDCELFSSCEPCPMCMGAIYWANIGKLYYAATREDAAKAGFKDKHIYRELTLSIERRSLPSVQINSNDAIEIFEQWIKSDKKILY